MVSKETCPLCGSRDNLIRYPDGHAYCFTPGCEHYEHKPASSKDKMTKMVKGKVTKATSLVKFTDRGPKRDIGEKVLEKYGVFVGKFSRQLVRVFPYYDQKGRLAYQKVRFPDDKDGSKQFTWIKAYKDAPKVGDCKLFGQQAFGERYDKTVVVCVGEWDALSLAQAAPVKRTVAVSVPSGDKGALQSIRENYDWLDGFETVLLWFDNDKLGQSVISECAQMFSPGKVKVALHQDYKDANELLVAKGPDGVKDVYYGAAVWCLPGTVNAKSSWERFRRGLKRAPSWPYPWPDLQERTQGQRRGELTLHVAGTGAAKSTIMMHYAKALVSVKDGPSIGWFGFEESLDGAFSGLISIYEGLRLSSKDLQPENERWLKELFTKAFAQDKTEIYDPELAEGGKDALLRYIKNMVRVSGVEVIFLDPLSIMMSMLGVKDVSAQDELAATLATMTRQLDIHMHVSHHLRKADGKAFEEGNTISIPDARGSGMLAGYATNIIAYERDQQGDRPDLLQVRLLKCRARGKQGAADVLKYDTETGLYGVTKEEMPGQDAAKGGTQGGASSGGFGKDY